MKKALTAVLMISLLASLSVPAFAATNNGTENTSIPVDGIYQAADAPADTVSVDIVWDSMSFTYTAPSKGTWNANDHKYENPTEGGWAATNGADPKITVTNHSNVSVDASFDFTGDVDGLTGSFTKNTLVLDSAEGTEVDNAPKGETAFSVSGSAIDKDEALGTITVTVGKLDTTPQTISTADELLATADKVGVFRLANDIDLDSTQLSISSPEYVLDLGGFTFSSSAMNSIKTENASDVTIKNGKIVGDFNICIQSAAGSKLTLENCTFTLGRESALWIDGTVEIRNCTFNGPTDDETCVTIYVPSGTAIFSGDVRVNRPNMDYSLRNQGTATILNGTYNFDPTAYVDSAKFTVTKNEETGIWTVTAK